MMVLFKGSVSKDTTLRKSNEDAFSISTRLPDSPRVAVSDGASESFDSRSWARILTRRFVHDPKIDPLWLESAIAEYRTQYKLAELSWSKEAAYLRGSFATLIGISGNTARDAVEVTAIGDSLVVLLRQGKLLHSFPYQRASEFSQDPVLLCTNSPQNAFISASTFPEHRTRWKIDENSPCTILVMTDALGEWALRNAEEGDQVWEQLSLFHNRRAFRRFVLDERRAKRMRIDDTTLLVLSWSDAQTRSLL